MKWFFIMNFDMECVKVSAMRHYLIISVLVCVLSGIGLCCAGEPGGIEFGPIISHDWTVDGSERWRILGPLVEKQTMADGRVLWAFRPFFSAVNNPAEHRSDHNVLWPVWIERRVGDRMQWSFVCFTFWHDWNVNDPRSRYSLWVLPIYFQGRDENKKPYVAVFPLGGTIRDFILWDELNFVLFPVMSHLRMKQVETTSFLWPIFASVKGAGVKRFRVFPFYGVSKRRTDYEKRFVLWPFWTSSRYGMSGSSGYGYILFPFFGHLKLEDQESWFFIPPLFRFSKGARMNLIYCPWPLFQKSSGEVDKLYIWPFWGRKTRGSRKTSFLLWPLCLRSTHYEENLECKRNMVLPVVFIDTKRAICDDKSKRGDVVFRSVKVWPLLSSLRDGDRFYFHFPSLFPYKDFEVIERNYAPLWTLYSHSRAGAVSEDELLWGLFRYRRSETMMDLSLFPVFSVGKNKERNGYEWSLLKGLVGYKRTSEARSIRLFYIFTIGGG